MVARAQTIQHDNVPEDGMIDTATYVPVEGRNYLSPPDGGCGAPDCKCVSHHFMRIFPRDENGTVFGYCVECDTREELEAMSESDMVALAQRSMH
jgi:hypothetical protein